MSEDKTTKPEFLYHYTSLETLALILDTRTLCFNNLTNVDDLEEAETADMGRFGKYINVSCWTADKRESIALWNLYTPNMHGVRLKMPIFPFKKYSYKKGEYYFTEDVVTFINEERIFSDNRASVVPAQPQLVQIKYTDDKSLLFPTVKTVTYQDGGIGKPPIRRVHYSFKDLGKYKRKDWEFQKEWRYIISFGPMGMQEMYPVTFEKQTECIRRLEDTDQDAPYQRFFLELDEAAVQNMEVLLGPRMSPAEKILAKALLKKHGLSNQHQESSLRIR